MRYYEWLLIKCSITSAYGYTFKPETPYTGDGGTGGYRRR